MMTPEKLPPIATSAFPPTQRKSIGVKWKNFRAKKTDLATIPEGLLVKQGFVDRKMDTCF